MSEFLLSLKQDIKLKMQKLFLLEIIRYKNMICATILIKKVCSISVLLFLLAFSHHLSNIFAVGMKNVEMQLLWQLLFIFFFYRCTHFFYLPPFRWNAEFRACIREKRKFHCIFWQVPVRFVTAWHVYMKKRCKKMKKS